MLASRDVSRSQPKREAGAQEMQLAIDRSSQGSSRGRAAAAIHLQKSWIMAISAIDDELS